MPEYLYSERTKIFHSLKHAKNIILFIDYDGTLIPFEKRPDAVHTPSSLKTLLSELNKKKKVHIIVITGRTLSEIQDLINVPGLSYAALHGFDICLEDGLKYQWMGEQNIQRTIENIKKHITPLVQNEAGIYIENKTCTLAFHYRLVSNRNSKRVINKFLETVKEVDKEQSLEILFGSKVIEVRPKGWNKGKAVELILNHFISETDALPIYIGDDTTDEDAFSVLSDKALTIYVSNMDRRKTMANYWLNDPKDVNHFLRELNQILE